MAFSGKSRTMTFLGKTWTLTFSSKKHYYFDKHDIDQPVIILFRQVMT